MKAIILAAGAGTRLQSLTNGNPKCLLRIGSKTLIEHHLDALQSHNITDIIIVLGFKKEQIISYVENFPFNFTFIENKEYLTTNTIYSLWLARETMARSDFLYFNADVLGDKRIVKYLLDAEQKNILAINKARCAEEEVKVILNNEQIVEIGKQLDPHLCAGEFIGIGKFSVTSNEQFITCMQNYISHNEKNLFFEKAVNDLCKIHPIYALDVTHIPCIEIDFEEDYHRAVA
ncbi:phosphocholine cytidylyltransferase family protein, partial [bacterium]|nr:phosphocholine cytidylyltransferase family protein [bacterium]